MTVWCILAKLLIKLLSVIYVHIYKLFQCPIAIMFVEQYPLILTFVNPL